MKKSIKSVLKVLAIATAISISFVMSAMADTTSTDKPVNPAPQIRVLFVGNSSTYKNDMPNMVKGLATAAEQNVYIQTITASAYKLYQFANETNTYGAQLYSALKNNKWDYVILQDHRDIVITDLQKTVDAVNTLKPYIDKAGAEMILYETQSDYIGKSFLADGFSYYLSHNEMQYYMTKGYFTVANKIGAKVATSGVNFSRCIEKYPEIVLYNTDDYIHPSISGSYLAACTLYQAIFDTSAYGNKYLPGSEFDTDKLISKMTIETAQNLQEIADPTLTLKTSYVEVQKGDTGSIEAKVNMSETNTGLDEFANVPMFSTLNDKAVSVNKKTGTYNALSVGESQILVTTDSGLLSMCTISVKQPATAFVINEKNVTEVYRGAVVEYTTKLSPSDTTDTVTWTSSDTKVATVDENGKVTAKKIGVAKITATTTSGIKNVRYVRVKLITPKNVKVKKLSTKAKGKKYANVKISWKKNSNAVNYYIYRSSGSGYKKIAATTKTSYVDKNKKKGKTYRYKIKSIYSNTKCNSDRTAGILINLK